MATTKALELSQFSSGLILDEATSLASLGVQVGVDRIGVNTPAAPTDRLEVYDNVAGSVRAVITNVNAGGTSTLRFANATGAAAAMYENSSNSFTLQNATAGGTLRLQTTTAAGATNNAIAIDQNQNVVISAGTLTTSNLVSVTGGTLNTTYTSTQVRLADGSIQAMKTVAGGVFESFRAINNDTTVGTTVRVLGAATSDPFNNANGGKVFIDAVRTATNMDLVFSLNDVSGAAPVERLRIAGSGAVTIGGALSVGGTTTLTGSVGIGTNNPNAKLDVNGSFASSLTNGGIFLRDAGGDAATNTIEAHLRATSGKSAFLTFTENAIADRWIVGTKAGDGALYFNLGSVVSNNQKVKFTTDAIQLGADSGVTTSYIRPSSSPAGHTAGNAGTKIILGDGASFRYESARNAANTFNDEYLTFHTHRGGVSIGERMRINPDGHVSIGTTATRGGEHILSLSGGIALGFTSATTSDIISSGGGNNSTYNGLALISNASNIGAKANTALPSWIVDIGGRAADGSTFNVNKSDTFTISRSAASGTFYGSTEVFRINNAGDVVTGNSDGVPFGRLSVHKTVDNGSVAATEVSDFKRATITIHNQDNFASGVKTGLIFAHAGGNGADGTNGGVASAISGYKEAGSWRTGLVFYTNNITGGIDTDWLQQRAKIDPDGNLTLGTPSAWTAQARFEMVGNLSIDLNSDTSASTLMNAGVQNNMLMLRAPFNSSPETTNNNGAKWGIGFYGGPPSERTGAGSYPYVTQGQFAKGAGIYAVSEDTGAGYNRRVGLAFHTTSNDQQTTERVRIDSDGNVGINTGGNGNGKLTIYDTTNARLFLTDSTLGTTYGGQIRGSGVTGAGGNISLGVVDNNVYNQGMRVFNQATQISFYINNGANGSTTERLTIQSNGNIKIVEGNYFHGGGFGRLWMRPGRQIGQAAYAGLYGPVLTYMADHNGTNWVSTGGGGVSALTMDEGILSFSSQTGFSAGGQTINWTTKLIVDTSGNLNLPVGALQIGGNTVFDSSRNLTVKKVRRDPIYSGSCSSTGDNVFNIITLIGNTIGSGIIHVMGNENNVNQGYAQYMFNVSIYSQTGTWYVRIKEINRIQNENNHGRPQLYLSTYASTWTDVEQAAQSTDPAIGNIFVRSNLGQLGMNYRISVEHMNM